MPNWEQIRKEWETTKITFKALAEKHGLKEGTLKSRRSREKWSRNKDVCKTKKDATISKGLQPKKEEKEPVVESDNLTDKQRLFCIYYVKYYSAIKAYQKAYECSYTAAHSNAHRLMANEGIKTEIERMKKNVADGLMLDATAVLQKYIDIAFSDIGDYVQRGDGGYSVTVRPLEQMDTSIISELSNTENGIKIKLADKMKALDFLAKHFDMVPDHFKRRIEEERLALDKARLEKEQDNEKAQEDWKEALHEVAERRKRMRQNEKA